MASDGEVNAAFDVIKPKLQRLVQEKVPGFFRATVAAELEAPATTRALVDMIRDALKAAEHQRKAEQPN